jgi:hypothetical protein
LADVRRTIDEPFETILLREDCPSRRAPPSFEQIVAEILGLGPIEPLLSDDTITEIMVNGARNIYIERRGKILREPAAFESDDHLMRIIDRIVSPLGRRIDEASPYVDARLPDGSRVNAVIPPISLVGPVLTIRKFARNPITVEQLIEYGTITAEAVEFLKACVISRINAVISGGICLGKTTMPTLCRSTSRPTSASSRSRTPPSSQPAGARRRRLSPARPTSRGGARSRSRIWWSPPSACVPTASSSARFAMRPPWTCSRR